MKRLQGSETMIDWHSHILPGMDDGSKNVEESLCLMAMLTEQGVDTVVATPHFYANDESVDSFLERRAVSVEKFQAQLSDSLPEVLLGAEVSYYPGISKMSGLKRLVIENTQLLLLEMPMSKWTEYTCSELTELSCSGEMQIILAHVERYLSYQSADVLKCLFESNLLMQVNATFFTQLGSRRKALRMLENGKIQFIGSDTHNTTTRPPHIKKAFEIIQRKFGDDFIKQMNGFGYSMLVQNHKKNIF